MRLIQPLTNLGGVAKTVSPCEWTLGQQPECHPGNLLEMKTPRPPLFLPQPDILWVGAGNLLSQILQITQRQLKFEKGGRTERSR